MKNILLLCTLLALPAWAKKEGQSTSVIGVDDFQKQVIALGQEKARSEYGSKTIQLEGVIEDIGQMKDGDEIPITFQTTQKYPHVTVLFKRADMIRLWDTSMHSAESLNKTGLQRFYLVTSIAVDSKEQRVYANIKRHSRYSYYCLNCNETLLVKGDRMVFKCTIKDLSTDRVTGENGIIKILPDDKE